MYGDDDVHCTLEQQPGAECVIVISFKMRPVLCRLSGSIRLVTGRGRGSIQALPPPASPSQHNTISKMSHKGWQPVTTGQIISFSTVRRILEQEMMLSSFVGIF